jgi:hypothetical protein
MYDYCCRKMAALLILVLTLTHALHQLPLSLLFQNLTLPHGQVNMYVICIVVELCLTFGLDLLSQSHWEPTLPGPQPNITGLGCIPHRWWQRPWNI